MWVMLFVWMVIATIIGGAFGAGVGFALFLAPLAYLLSYSATESPGVAACVTLGLIGLPIAFNEEEKSKAEAAKREAKRVYDIDFARRREREKGQAEVATAYDYLSRLNDKESMELCDDYLKYYRKGLMDSSLAKNFEEKIIVKAKPLIDAEIEAEELRRRQQEAIEEELWDQAQKRLAEKYGGADTS